MTSGRIEIAIIDDSIHRSSINNTRIIRFRYQRLPVLVIHGGGGMAVGVKHNIELLFGGGGVRFE